MSSRGDIDYLEKYGPFLQILADEMDLEEVAAEPGYTRAAGVQYKAVRLRALAGYMVTLASDFAELKSALMQRAMQDARLAETLLQTEQSLQALLRRIRLRIFFEQLLPAPKPSPHPGRLRRLAISVLSRPSPPLGMLRAMNELREALA
jgi:hypothetical protein